MKVRRKLELVLFLKASSASLIDSLNKRGELEQLMTLFINNIDNIIEMNKGKEFITKEDFLNFKDNLLEAVSDVIHQTKEIETKIINENTKSELEKISSEVIVAESPLRMEDLGIEIEVEIEDNEDYIYEDDEDEFNIV